MTRINIFWAGGMRQIVEVDSRLTANKTNLVRGLRRRFGPIAGFEILGAVR